LNDTNPFNYLAELPKRAAARGLGRHSEAAAFHLYFATGVSVALRPQDEKTLDPRLFDGVLTARRF
jgi:hypothetical protein